MSLGDRPERPVALRGALRHGPTHRGKGNGRSKADFFINLLV